LRRSTPVPGRTEWELRNVAQQQGIQLRFGSCPAEPDDIWYGDGHAILRLWIQPP